MDDEPKIRLHMLGAPLFKVEQFSDGEFYSAKDDVAFANWLANFVRSGFKRERFSKKGYRRLSNFFSHIAHYDRDGFYHEWFRDTASQLEWVHHVCGCPYAYSNVEKAIVAWLRSTTIEANLCKKIDVELETQERATLARLKAKYEGKS